MKPLTKNATRKPSWAEKFAEVRDLFEPLGKRRKSAGTHVRAPFPAAPRRVVDTGPEFNQAPEPNVIQLLELIQTQLGSVVVLAPDVTGGEVWRLSAGRGETQKLGAGNSFEEAVRDCAARAELKAPPFPKAEDRRAA